MNKRMMRVAVGMALGLGVGAAAIVANTREVAAGGEVNPACSNATAVLLVGTKDNRASLWTDIRTFMANKRVWELGQMNQGYGSPSQLTEWDIAQYPGGPDTAFTVRCGSGATCNEIAKQYAAEHKDLKPAPYVFCGDSPIFANPTDPR